MSFRARIRFLQRSPGFSRRGIFCKNFPLQGLPAHLLLYIMMLLAPGVGRDCEGRPGHRAFHPLTSPSPRREFWENPIAEVLLRHKTESDFRTLTEWLTGRRSPDGRCVLRSDEGRRKGLYWILRLSKPLSAPGSCRSIRLQYVHSGDLEVQERRIAVSGLRLRGAREVLLGVTDDPSLRNPDDVAAWCVELQDFLGKTFARKQSFLWSADDDTAAEKPETGSSRTAPAPGT